MAFLSSDTGQLLFRDGVCLHGEMSEEILAQYGVNPEDGNGCFCMPPHPVRGGNLAPIITLENGRVSAVTLSVAMIGIRQDADTDRQRSFLLQTLGLKDPCPDTRGAVRVVYPFGEILLCTDPYTGGSTARVIYSTCDE